jgi:hypothetical protein
MSGTGYSNAPKLVCSRETTLDVARSIDMLHSGRLATRRNSNYKMVLSVNSLVFRIRLVSFAALAQALITLGLANWPEQPDTLSNT